MSSLYPELRQADRLFIGGEWLAPATSGRITVIGSHNGEAVAKVAEAVQPDIDRAVAAARAAFDHGPWPRLSPAERAGYIRRIADQIDARSAALSAMQSIQMGAVASVAGISAYHAAQMLRDTAQLADSFPFVEKRPAQMGGEGWKVHEPVGVVGAIVPWNAPLVLLSLKLGPALLAGCTIIVKASPEAPGEALILAEICEDIGLPPGVINVVTSDREASEHLVRHPQVDKISFTGSSAAGRRIAAICGDRIARCTLELGGKSAAVLLDDFDPAAAAQSLAGSLLFMNGQVCAALTRAIVPRSRQAEFVEAAAAVMSSVLVGDPFDPASQLGPIATGRQRDRIEACIAQGKAEGARLASGGGRPAGRDCGWYLEPTLFCDTAPDTSIAQEEIFGPVLTVIPVDSEEEAVAVANGTPFGLNSAVFSNDPDRAWKIGRRLRAGTVGHNGFKADFGIGFGGFKQSGIGREGGTEGLRSYLEVKAMIMETGGFQPQESR